VSGFHLNRRKRLSLSLQGVHAFCVVLFREAEQFEISVGELSHA
jgi:hypothetical protein